MADHGRYVDVEGRLEELSAGGVLQPRAAGSFRLAMSSAAAQHNPSLGRLHVLADGGGGGQFAEDPLFQLSAARAAK